jgi:hypothetical protein
MKPETQVGHILYNFSLTDHPHAEGLASTIERAIIAAIEEAREGCAKICDEEAEYYRSMSNAGSPYESAIFHRTGAKVAAHLARKIRAHSEEKGVLKTEELKND